MNKRKYSLEINWKKEELIKFLSENKIKMLKYINGRMDSHNKVIQGDGIDAISSLIISGDKFEIVMIDPPYNENKSKGKYKDQWKGSGKDFNWAGENHGAYLDFLYPRLILGKEVLTDDGMMMVFIGDGEYHYLRILMDKIFGEGNYVGTVIWDSSANQQKTKIIDRNHEYVLIYAKNINKTLQLKIKNESLTGKDLLAQYAQSLRDKGLDFKAAEKLYVKKYEELNSAGKLGPDSVDFRWIHPITFVPFMSQASSDPRKGYMEPLVHPATGKACKIPGKGWRFSRQYINDLNEVEECYELHDGSWCKLLQSENSERVAGIIFGKDEDKVPRSVYIHHESSSWEVLKTTGYNYSKIEKKEGIDPKTGFETVKPIDFLRDIILHYPDKNARILDYFAGSGTTAVSVARANEKDKGNRSWTLVELNETTVKDVLIPKLKYFGITDFKHMNISACNMKAEDVDKYFRTFMFNYIQSEREYVEIHKDSSLGYSVIGVEGETLILSSLQKSETDKAPRPTLFTKEIEPYLKDKKIKKIFVYMVGSENFRASWDVLIKDTVATKYNISAKDIKILSLPGEIKSKWENLIDQLSQYEDHGSK